MTVGETLSLARRERGLSVDDVAADTRIRATLIEAIEADRFGPCGGAVYARGHIRSIARVVGVDPEPLIGQFDAPHDADRVVAAVAAGPASRKVVARSERRRPNWMLAMAAALVVICALAVAGLVSSHSGGKPRTTDAGRKTGTHHTGPATQQAPPVTQTPPAASGSLASSRATLVVRTSHGPSWLSIKTKTGASLYTGTLPAGERKSFTNRLGLAVIIGNAPAVDLVVNGHDIGSPPSVGSVSHGTVSPGSATIQQA